MKKLIVPVALGTSLIGLVGCGSDSNNNAFIPQEQQDANQQEERQQQQDDQGRYYVNLTSLNNSVAGKPTGRAEINVQGDEVQINLNMINLRERSQGHRQYVYEEGECPEAGADNNGDGLIDHEEGAAVYGDQLLALDGNLENVNTEEDFPTASNRSYRYNEQASLSRLLAEIRGRSNGTPQQETDQQAEQDQLDLQQDILPQDQQQRPAEQDQAANDQQAQEAPAADDQQQQGTDQATEQQENLDLQGKTIVVHGVPNQVNLPNTVAGNNNNTRVELLPIACGTIVRFQEAEAQQDQEQDQDQEQEQDQLAQQDTQADQQLPQQDETPDIQL
jgi:hypothetical protein